MKVILTSDIKGVGKSEEIVNVSEGYARNFLFPRNLAVEANKANMAQIEKKHKLEEAKEERNIDEAKAIVARLSELKITIKGKVGTGSRLYGSITSADIAETLEKQHAIKIDKRKIELDEPIKNIGTYDVPVRLHRLASTKLKVEVTGE